MKKLYAFLIFSASLGLQAQVIENPGFEEWESLSNGNPEPVNWSSIQSGDPQNLSNLSPQVLFKDSLNPHSGNYCISLKNVHVAIANIVANGLTTNGRVHADFNPDLGYVFTDADEPKWNTPCTTRPDSIVGYYRYSPQGGDITVVQALLHSGESGKIPDDNSTGYVGTARFESPNETIAEWTRFSAPIEYLNNENPEYILLNISAGNGTTAIANSQAWYDDFELVYNTVGLDENTAMDLLNLFSKEQNIVIDMRKFGAGDVFDLEIYTITGQLVLRDQTISGYAKEIAMESGGIFICTLKNKDGLTISKKVFVPN